MVFIYNYSHIFNVNIEWNRKTITLLAFLAVFPNVLGLFHADVLGINLHFFQYLIFLAAIIYGPLGGLAAGAFGSVWTAASMHNPYILIGNVILGFLAGLFIRLRWNVILAVLAAYIIQMPWLWLTDVYLAGMPTQAVNMIVIALFFSDLIMGFLAGLSYKHLKDYIKIIP